MQKVADYSHRQLKYLTPKRASYKFKYISKENVGSVIEANSIRLQHKSSPSTMTWCMSSNNLYIIQFQVGRWQYFSVKINETKSRCTSAECKTNHTKIFNTVASSRKGISRFYNPEESVLK